jgi:hypothetical protein
VHLNPARHERVYFCLEKSMSITAKQLLQILPHAGAVAADRKLTQ